MCSLRFDFGYERDVTVAGSAVLRTHTELQAAGSLFVSSGQTI
jgi:hypothetical protein